MDTEPKSLAEWEAMWDHMVFPEAFWVLDVDEMVYGWAQLKQWSPKPGYRHSCETSIYLDRHQTGKGWGTMLQTALQQYGTECGIRHLVARIWRTNKGSIRFHERFGYRVVGVQEQVGCMGGVWQDVVILQNLLPTDLPYVRS